MEKEKFPYGILIFPLLILAIVYVTKSLNSMAKERTEMLSTGEYTIGTYDGRPYQQDHKYTYRVNNVDYNGSDGICVRFIPEGFDPSENEGGKFLVLYDKNDPSHSYLCFEYPIKTSADFNRYVKELRR